MKRDSDSESQVLSVLLFSLLSGLNSHFLPYVPHSCQNTFSALLPFAIYFILRFLAFDHKTNEFANAHMQSNTKCPFSLRYWLLGCLRFLSFFFFFSVRGLFCQKWILNALLWTSFLDPIYFSSAHIFSTWRKDGNFIWSLLSVSYTTLGVQCTRLSKAHVHVNSTTLNTEKTATVRKHFFMPLCSWFQPPCPWDTNDML